MAVRLLSLVESLEKADDIQQNEMKGPNSIPKFVAFEIAFVV